LPKKASVFLLYIGIFRFFFDGCATGRFDGRQMIFTAVFPCFPHRDLHTQNRLQNNIIYDILILTIISAPYVQNESGRGTLSMGSAFLLILASLLPVVAAAIFHHLDRNTNFVHWKFWPRQIIIGIVFGGLAVIGTEYGIPFNGAQVNCRDAAVITAGLFFGGPAGIIAGIIGGVERWVAVAWGIGTFTRVACSFSTIIAGFYAAVLRRFLFKEKRPSWSIAMAIGVVMEVFHLTMVFITNMGTPAKAMAVVRSCTVPMLLANGLSVMLAAVVLSTMDLNRLSRVKIEKKRVAQLVQSWMMLVVVFAFFITSFFVYRLQTAIADTDTEALLSTALEEVQSDIAAAEELGISDEIIGMIKNRHVGKTGFIMLLSKDFKPISAPDVYSYVKLQGTMKTLGIVPKEGVLFRAQYGGAYYYNYFIKYDGNLLIASLPEEEAMLSRNIALYVNVFLEIMVFALMFALIFRLIDRTVVRPLQNVTKSLNHIAADNLEEGAVDEQSSAEFVSLSTDINAMVNTLQAQRRAEQERLVLEQERQAKELERQAKELDLAKNIQASALPRIFPAFPQRHDFDIYASMRPAKEVGGDFYDFYMTDVDKQRDVLHFLIADVSGKGVPAAMFMMSAKAELKTLTERKNMQVGDVFTRGNNALCEGNDAGMFVTAWQGGIDLETGTVSFANAGHNPPLVRHQNGKFEYLKSKVGLVLAGMKDIPYRTQNLQLEPGDIIFLYTDGVTEATNARLELFGEDRLLETLNSRTFTDMKELCQFVRDSVDAFVGDAPQFDDITMLALRYFGEPPAPTISFEEAKLEDIPAVTAFVEEELEKIDCPMKIVTQFSIAIDEIFSNIVKYGYAKKPGPVEVKVIVRDDPHEVSLKFTDSALPYNPLTKADPDVTLSADERSVGGLGIFMVKKSMDDIKYKYENEQNILTIFKKLPD